MQLAGVCDAIKKKIQIYTRKTRVLTAMGQRPVGDCRDVPWRVSTGVSYISINV